MNKYALLNKELFEKLRENGEIVIPVRNQIILNNLKLALKTADRFKDTKDIEYKDAIQIAFLGLQKAVENFDESRGATFATYATSIMKYDIYRVIKHEKSHQRWKKKCYSVECSNVRDKYDIEYIPGETEELFMEDIIPDLTEMIEDKVAHADYLIIQDVGNKILSETEKYALDNIYNENPKSYREIGEEIGKTKQGVDSIENRAIKKIKSNLSVNRYHALEKI